MIRILMLDLGETLVSGGSALPHVPEALDAMLGFETAAGEPLPLCLVSDFHMPAHPGDAAEVADIFADYLAALEGFGLRDFFEPVEQHVTLSTHAGVFKPDRRVFELAVERLGLDAGLDEALFITENVGHVEFCRDELGMATLVFGPAGAPGVDFSDWAEAPLLVGRIIAPESEAVAELALRVHLAAAHGMELLSVEKKSGEKKRGGARVRGRAKRWVPVRNPKSGGGEQLHVRLPADVEVEMDEKGRVRKVEGGQPDAETVQEAEHFVKTLEDNQQIAHDPETAPPGATHEVETDAEGKKRLVRKRYSAI